MPNGIQSRDSKRDLTLKGGWGGFWFPASELVLKDFKVIKILFAVYPTDTGEKGYNNSLTAFIVALIFIVLK